MIRFYAIAAAIATLAAFMAYQRHDARQDLKRELEAARPEHIEKAREIENETRSDTDDALTNCLLGRQC